jgi:hypothetical protein
LNGIRIEDVYCFRYFGVDIDRDSCMKSEIMHRVSEGEKVIGVLRTIHKGEQISMDAKREVCADVDILVPTLLYNSEVRATSADDRIRIRVMKMSCMGAPHGAILMERVRDKKVQKRCGSEISIGARMDRNVLRWYDHVERMES